MHTTSESTWKGLEGAVYFADSSFAMLTTHLLSEIGNELAALVRIQEQSRLQGFALQESDKQKIIEIFENVDESRKRLMVRPNSKSSTPTDPPLIR